MERYNLALMTKRIYDSGLKVFTLDTLRVILAIEKESSAFGVIKRLAINGVLEKIERNKYLLAGAEIHDFALANFLYSPSYISFESALNFHGVLSQFPYEITSVSSRKTVKKNIAGKLFSYARLQKSLFWGYEKKNGFLIASSEKALFDQAYLSAKGLKTLSWDEYDLTLVNQKKLKSYLKKL